MKKNGSGVRGVGHPAGWLLFTVLAAGCPSTPEQDASADRDGASGTDASGDGTMRDAASDDSATDAAPPDATADAATDAATDATGADIRGTILLAQSVDAGSAESAASAEFRPPGDATGCTRRENASCSIRVCNRPFFDTRSQHSAGTITITPAGAAPMTLRFGSAYGGDSATMERWSSGQRFDVQAAGAEVPAFTGAVTFPAPLPMLTGYTTGSVAGRARVSRTAGFTASWTPAAGVVDVLIDQFELAREVEVRCTFDRMTGTANIPGGALTDLTPASNGASIRVESVARTMLTAGSVPVSVLARDTRVFLRGDIE